MRLFLALPLPEPLKVDLAGVQAQLKARGLRASWTEPRQLHLTLAFLGEQDPAGLEPLGAMLDTVAARHADFALETTTLGAFPRAAQARVLWMGLALEPRLEALVEDLRQGLSSLRLPFDPKPFQAHLTLARFRTPTRLPDLEPVPEPRSFQAGRLVLYESVLQRGGAVHTPRREADLRNERD